MIQSCAISGVTVSVLEEIRSLESQVLTRLRELEPLLAEYQELRQAAERLGLDYKPDGRRKPVNAGERDRQVLEAVRKQPGITVPQLGKALGVDYTGLYRVVRRLEGSGQIRKNGARLELS
jgi:uncharacterized membrane protein